MYRRKWSAWYSDGHQATEQKYRLQVSIIGIPPKNAPNISHQFAFSWQFLVTIGSIFLVRDSFSESLGGLFAYENYMTKDWRTHRRLYLIIFSPRKSRNKNLIAKEPFLMGSFLSIRRESDSNGSSSLRKFGMEFWAPNKNSSYFQVGVPFNSTTFFQGPPFHLQGKPISFRSFSKGF